MVLMVVDRLICLQEMNTKFNEAYREAENFTTFVVCVVVVVVKGAYYQAINFSFFVFKVSYFW